MTSTTGIVRRVDDLGRIVIPKEMRTAMGIHEGIPLEICSTSDGIVIKKYLPALGLADMARDMETMLDLVYKEVDPGKSVRIRRYVKAICELCEEGGRHEQEKEQD